MEFRKMTFKKEYIHSNRVKFAPGASAELREDMAAQLEAKGYAESATLKSAKISHSKKARTAKLSNVPIHKEPKIDSQQ